MKDNITDTNIPDIVQRYLDGVCTEEEQVTAKRWLCEHINDSGLDEDFERILEKTAPVIDDESMTRSRQSLENFIYHDSSYRLKERRNRHILGWMAGLASVATAIAITLLFSSQEPVQWHEAYTRRGETERLTLSDGTSLWLNSDTKVIYPSHFDSDTRTIFVDGEVYADVTPDKKKPFIISASDIRVKVHGTQFSIKAYAEMTNVEVALISGSVTVEGHKRAKEFTKRLVPGDLIRYDKGYGTLEEYRINPQTYGTWQNNQNIRFINQSLADIAEDLERRFDVEIIIGDDLLAKTQYYASFVNNEGLDKILGALNSNGTMKISKNHDTILITSK